MFTNAHIDAVNRPRNVINLFDANFTIHLAPLKSPLGLVSKNTNNLLPDHPDVDAFMKYQFTFTDDQDTHTDTNTHTNTHTHSRFLNEKVFRDF